MGVFKRIGLSVLLAGLFSYTIVGYSTLGWTQGNYDVMLFVSWITLSPLLFWLFTHLSSEVKCLPRRRLITFISSSALFSAILIAIIPINSDSLPIEHSIVITAMGTKNVRSFGSEVWVQQVQVGGTEVAVSEFKKGDGWVVKNGIPVALSGHVATLTWQGRATGGAKIQFVTHQWSGLATASIDQFREEVDLYSSPGSQRTVSYSFHGPSVLEKITIYLSIFLMLSAGFLLFSVQVSRKHRSVDGTSTAQFSWRACLILSAPLAIVWTISLLAYYPGVLTVDSIDQWGQAITHEFNDWHPVVDTLTIWILTRLWNSPAVVIVVQIVCQATVIGYTFSILYRWGVPRYALIIASCFYALFPAVFMMTLSLWTDIPYSISILMLTCILILILFSNGEWLNSVRHQIILGVILTMVALYRHNGILVAFGTGLMLLYALRKYTRAVLKSLVVLFMLILVVEVPLYDFLHVKRAPLWLGFGIPITQIGAVINSDGVIGSEQEHFINSILPMEEWKKNYNSYSLNSTIFDPRFNGEVIGSNIPHFVGTWARIVKQNSYITLNAWRQMTSLIWRIRQPAGGYTYEVDHGVSANPYGIKSHSVIPALRGILDKYVYWSEDLGRISIFWRPALLLYLTFLMHWIFRIRNNGFRKIGVLPVIPVSFNAISLLFSIPAQDVRYLFSTFLVFPIICMLSFVQPKD